MSKTLDKGHSDVSRAQERKGELERGTHTRTHKRKERKRVAHLDKGHSDVSRAQERKGELETDTG
jgi:hypothetical protein